MEKKLGIYFCSGCSIGDALDMEALEKQASGEHKAAVCKTHEFLCCEEGVAVIKEDIEKESVNTVVIGACSARVNTDVFAFPENIILDRVNLREHVAWCQKPKDEDTQMLAEDYLTIGVIRATKSELLEPYIAENLSSKILVVGGGLAGITAAHEAAQAGYNILLVEKEAELGGWFGKQFKQLPRKQPYTTLEENDILSKIEEIEDNDKIEIVKTEIIYVCHTCN